MLNRKANKGTRNEHRSPRISRKAIRKNADVLRKVYAAGCSCDPNDPADQCPSCRARVFLARLNPK